MDIKLRGFQKRFLRSAFKRGITTAALSLPRGQGKTALCGYIAKRTMTPGDPWFKPGTESIVCAASLEQGRLVFRAMREMIGESDEYRWADSITRIHCLHKPTNTRLRVIASKGRTAMGLVGVPLVIADEPGAWETVGGELMHDAIDTALGKPDSPLKVIYVGTLAPATSGWWHDMIDDGSHGSTYVQAIKGDPEKWDSPHEIRRCNPLSWYYPESRKVLLEQRDEARTNSRKKAAFLSYRLNIPSLDESKTLLEPEEWRKVMARDPGGKDGRFIVAMDLGGGRAWSAAVAIWASGHVEAIASAPGIPDLETQEKRDRVPRGSYRRLHELGMLQVVEGKRVQPPGDLVEAVMRRWGLPVQIICDRFRLSELQDLNTGIPITPRVTRWSEAAEDIRALRKMAFDGPLTTDAESGLLIAESLKVAEVKTDDQGNVRLMKRKNNTARDDVAAALLLACGIWERETRRQPAGEQVVDRQPVVAR